jgi:hypothetical protein
MSEELSIPTFDELDQALAQYGDEVSPVEIHAILVGFQCGGVPLFDEALVSTLQDFFGLDVYMAPELPFLLSQLSVGVDASLRQDDFTFMPMLPEEGDFEEQVSLFSRWCESFINGFSATCPEEDNLSEDVEGVLDDLMTFSRMREEVDLSEQDEESLMELVEYLKVAILTIYTELVLVPQRQAEDAVLQAEKNVAPEKRIPPSDKLH